MQLNLLLLICLLFTDSLFSQKFNKEKHITINEGLSQNSVFSIIQDKKGFLWIGTKDGLNRYDGIDCKVFRRSSQSNSIANNSISYLLKDSEKNIWIGTARGLNKLNIEKEEFKTISADNSSPSEQKESKINCLLEDKDKSIWVGTEAGLKKIKSLQSVVYETLHEPSEIKNRFITCLYQDKRGTIWVATDEGLLYSIRKAAGAIETVPVDIPINRVDQITPVTSMCELQDEIMALGTSGNGVLLLDIRKRKLIFDFNKKSNYEYLYVKKIKEYGADYIVLTTRLLYKLKNGDAEILWHNKTVPSPTDFIIDNGGIIWIGSSGGGIVKLNPTEERFRTITKESDELNGFIFSSVRSILKHNKLLYIGGYTDLLMTKNYEIEKPQWDIVRYFRGKIIYSLAADPIDRNVIWVGTENTGFYRYNTVKASGIKYGNESKEGGVGTFADNVYNILVSGKGDIYFATQAGLLRYEQSLNRFTKYSHDKSIPNSINEGRVKSLFEDSFGNIWIGTASSGISLFNPAEGIFRKFDYSKNGEPVNELSDFDINMIMEDSYKNIWVGTADGLTRIITNGGNVFRKLTDKQKLEIKIYRTKDGLSNNCIYSVLEDNSGCFWMSTNSGLSKLEPIKGKFTNYDVSYELQSNEFNTGAYYKTDIGEMIFGGIKGITSIYPEKIIKNNFSPSVVFTEFRKYNLPVMLSGSISYIDQLELSYLDQVFSFKFIMPEYSGPTHHKFAYKLSGFDDNWIYLANGERTASFTNIPAGEYTLLVKGANSDGVWSYKESTIKLVIVPAYYSTLWFRGSVLFIFLSIIFTLYKTRVNKLKEEKAIQQELTAKLFNSQEEERRTISKELHDDLGQNLLVVKNSLLIARRKNNFNENIDEVLNILDNSIKDISNVSHLLHPSELETLGLDRSVEAMLDRLENSSRIKIINHLSDLDSYFDKDESINLYRIIQESLNNVVKHSKASEVTLTGMHINGNSYRLNIKDDGIGFNFKEKKDDKRPHLGLKSIRERAFMLRGVILIKSSPNTGTELIFTFKKRKKSG